MKKENSSASLCWKGRFFLKLFVRWTNSINKLIDYLLAIVQIVRKEKWIYFLKFRIMDSTRTSKITLDMVKLNASMKYVTHPVSPKGEVVGDVIKEKKSYCGPLDIRFHNKKNYLFKFGGTEKVDIRLEFRKKPRNHIWDHILRYAWLHQIPWKLYRLCWEPKTSIIRIRKNLDHRHTRLMETKIYRGPLKLRLDIHRNILTNSNSMDENITTQSLGRWEPTFAKIKRHFHYRFKRIFQIEWYYNHREYSLNFTKIMTFVVSLISIGNIDIDSIVPAINRRWKNSYNLQCQ